MLNTCRNYTSVGLYLFLVSLSIFSSCSQKEGKNSSPQNPSPMTESIRPHERVSADTCKGKRVNWQLQDKSVQLYIPHGFDNNTATNLIIHFHGNANITEYAVCGRKSEVILTISGGSGSSSYEKLFKQGENWIQLLDRANKELGIQKASSITLTGWSAGYGAIRAILSRYEELINNIILLDGLHASYIPEKQVLYKGGKIDSSQLDSFLKFAKEAIKGKKQMLITHSSIFPGTYASTTESTEYLVRSLGLKRKPSLQKGPLGMQQVGESISGNLTILSFAGNTAPDHIDHLHGLYYFLNKFTGLQDEKGMH